MNMATYDVIIIGAGPAGMTAGIYCGRSGLKTLIVEKTGAGGQLLKMDLVENYPGFPDGVNSFDLIEKIKTQAKRFGVIFAEGEVSLIKRQGIQEFVATTTAGTEHTCKAVIIATGASPKGLGVKGESELQGRGVSYCATCDGPLFKNKDIVVVGGGDTAVGEAIYLTRFVKKLILVHRRDRLRAATVLQDRLFKEKCVEIRWGSVLTGITGDNKVAGVTVQDVKTGQEAAIPCQGVFVFVGIEPATGFIKDIVQLDNNGFIVADEHMKTSSEGIFGCGDARKNPLKQIVTACAEGALAAQSALQYLETLKT